MEAQLFDGLGTINTDWIGLKKIAAEFLRAAPTANADELDAGIKCFGIAWMNCRFADDFLGKIAQEAEHPALLRIVRRAYMQYRIPLVGGFDH